MRLTQRVKPLKTVYVVELRSRIRGGRKWSRWTFHLTTVDRDAAQLTKGQYATSTWAPEGVREYQARVVPFDRRKK